MFFMSWGEEYWDPVSTVAMKVKSGHIVVVVVVVVVVVADVF